MKECFKKLHAEVIYACGDFTMEFCRSRGILRFNIRFAVRIEKCTSTVILIAPSTKASTVALFTISLMLYK